jgi:hypothetical protein
MPGSSCLHLNVLVDGLKLALRIEVSICSYKFTVQVTIIWTIVLILAGQAVCYFVVDSIHMNEVVVIAGEVLPPLHLSIRQAWLGLEVFKAGVIGHYSEFATNQFVFPLHECL